MAVTKAEINLVHSLSDKRVRTENGLFAVEGRKMVGEALSSGFAVERIFGLPEFADVPGCEVVSGKEMERMSHLKTPPGVLALVGMPRRELPDEPGRVLTLALDGVQDPGNLGTILRLADWFGIRDVLCSPDCADCFNPKVVQATMGAVFRVRVHYAGLPAQLSAAAARGVPVYGTFLEGEDVYAARLAPDSGIIVMGSEGNGISPAVAASVTYKLYIPPYPAGEPAGESLNVATAAAILCSEFRRRG